MKRSLFYFAASALMLTACTSEDVIEDVAVTRNAIGFDYVVNKPSREAADLTYENLKQFNVFGYYTLPGDATKAHEVFKDVPVYRQENGTWTYYNPTPEPGTDPVDYRYWVKDAHYYFYAYSCGSITKLNSNYGSFTMEMADGLRPADRALKINDYICDASHQHDLIYAYNTGATGDDQWAGIVGLDKGNSNVAFKFKHILSKVQAQFTSKFPSEYEVVISDVTFENIRNIGSYNPNDGGGWQKVERKNGGHPFVYLLNTDNPDVMPIKTKVGGVAAKTQSAYVIPYAYNGEATTEGQSTWVYIKFTVKLMYGENLIMTKELSGKFNPNWKEGYNYTYNIELSGSTTNMEAIGFSVVTDSEGQVVDDWTQDSTPIIVIDNQ